MARFLATIAKLSRSFARLFRITFLSKSLKGTALVVVGRYIVGINEKSLVTGDKSFLIPLEVDKSNSFVGVGNDIVRIQVMSLIVGGKGFLVPLEVGKGLAFSEPFVFPFQGRWERAILECDLAFNGYGGDRAAPFVHERDVYRANHGLLGCREQKLRGSVGATEAVENDVTLAFTKGFMPEERHSIEVEPDGIFLVIIGLWVG